MKRKIIQAAMLGLFVIISMFSIGYPTIGLADTANTGEVFMYTQSVSVAITTAEGTTTYTTVPVSAGSGVWLAPCMDPPYDYQYRDNTRYITINQYTDKGITYYVADVQLADISAFQAALSGDKAYGKLEPVSAMADRNRAVLAINGDDYGTHKYGTIIRNGALIRANETTRNMMIVDQHGDMSILTDRKGEKPKELGQFLLAENVWHTFEFGPELVRGGQAVEFSAAFDVISTSSSRREPRTAIGQIGPLHYIIIVADGRQDGYSIGMTLPELQQLFVAYGAQTAMNLDGGGSSEIWFQGEIINRPAGGGERYVSDIIFY